MDENKNSSPRDHLANERTFLAWVRTSISIMGFGLVIFKFSLFEEYSGIVGMALVAVGSVIAILPYIYYKLTERQLNEGYYKYSSLPISVLTAFIFILSVILIIYLMRSK